MNVRSVWGNLPRLPIPPLTEIQTGHGLSFNGQFYALCWKDLATQIYFWDAYKSACKSKSLPRGEWVEPELGEYLVGSFESDFGFDLTNVFCALDLEVIMRFDFHCS